MADRRKLLIHFRRISSMLENAIAYGPDGTLEGKFGEEHPLFIHYANAFYLAGTLGYLESEDGEKSWNLTGEKYKDFDTFCEENPKSRDEDNPRPTFKERGVSKAVLEAMVCIRNAAVHNAADLSENRNKKSLDIVSAAGLPGVSLNGSVVTLEAEFLGSARLAALAVRQFHGET